MPITNSELWNDFVEKNDDPYGGCCVKVARRVMEILDEDNTPLSKKNDVRTLICKADDDVKAGGITGFMAGAVASMVSRCHSRGEEFRRGWNGDYGYDGNGVVNPALYTINLGDK